LQREAHKVTEGDSFTDSSKIQRKKIERGKEEKEGER
jgi:hypothetical protein